MRSNGAIIYQQPYEIFVQPEFLSEYFEKRTRFEICELYLNSKQPVCLCFSFPFSKIGSISLYGSTKHYLLLKTFMSFSVEKEHRRTAFCRARRYANRIFIFRCLNARQPGTVLNRLNARQSEIFTELSLKASFKPLKSIKCSLAMSSGPKNYCGFLVDEISDRGQTIPYCTLDT